MRSLIAVLSAGLALFVTGLASASTWTIDQSHSSVGFKIKHLMISNVYGEFKDVEGSIHYDSAKPEKSKVDVTIQMTSIDTQNEQRDEHLRGTDFFDVATYPTMTYKSKRVEKVDGGLKVYGELTMHGVTKEVVLDVEGPTDPMSFMGSTRIGATAHTTLDRRDFGLTWSKAMETGGLVVGNEVKIIIELELVKAE